MRFCWESFANLAIIFKEIFTIMRKEVIMIHSNLSRHISHGGVLKTFLGELGRGGGWGVDVCVCVCVCGGGIRVKDA